MRLPAYMTGSLNQELPLRNEYLAAEKASTLFQVALQLKFAAQTRCPVLLQAPNCGPLCQYRRTGTLMALWPTVRLVSTILLLLIAATEIFACELVSPDACIFSSHSTSDSTEGGSGDGCLCCCAHIVVVAPIVPLASLGFISRAVPFEDIQTPEFRPIDIEHPPRF